MELRTDGLVLIARVLMIASLLVVFQSVGTTRPESDDPDFDLDAFIENLDPPAIEAMIESLRPIPTIEECLVPLPDDPGATRRRVLTGEDKQGIDELETRIETLRDQGSLDAMIPLVDEIVATRRRIQGEDHFEVFDAALLRTTIAEVARLPDDLQTRFCESYSQTSAATDSQTKGLYAEAEENFVKALSGRRAALGDDHPYTIDSLNLLVNVLHQRGQRSRTLILASEVLEKRRRSLGDNHPQTAISLHNLGVLLKGRGDFDQAAPFFLKALAIQRELFGKEHVDYAQSLQSLATLHDDQGEYETAESLHREALATRRRLFGEESYAVAESLNNLASVLAGMGKYREAESHYREVIRIDRKVLGDRHPKVASALSNLATLLYRKGEYTETESLLRESLALERELLGDSHPSTAFSLNNLAVLLTAVGNLAEAEVLLQEALQIWEKVLGPEDYRTTVAMNNLAMAHVERGNLAEAERLQRKVLEIRETTLGEEHPQTALSMNNLASVLNERGDYAAAELLYRRALKIRRKRLGDSHPEVASTLSNLAVLLCDKGNFAAAERLHRECLAMRRDLLGDTHPSVANSLNNLALTLKIKGERREAARAYTEALAIYRALKGNDSNEAATILSNLGNILSEQGDRDEAESFYRKSLQVRRKIYGEDHLETALAMNNLASLLFEKGDVAAAESLARKALSIRRKELGKFHPDLALSLDTLSAMLESRGELEAVVPVLREALEIKERLRARLIGAELDRAQYAGTIDLNLTAARLVRFLVELGRAEESMSVFERGCGRALLDLISRSKHDLVGELRRKGDRSSGAELENQLEVLDASRIDLISAEKTMTALRRRSDLAREEKERLISGQLATIERARAKLGDSEAMVQSALREVWPEATPAKTETITAALDRDELILCFSWTRYGLTLLAVPSVEKGSIEGAVLLADQDEIGELGDLISEIREQLSTRPSTCSDRAVYDQIDRLNSDLAKRVPQKIQELINGSRRVVFVPSGPLTDLPCEVLLAAVRIEKEAGLLSDATPQTVLTESATIYINRKKERAARGTEGQDRVCALVLGNPLFDRGDESVSDGESGSLPAGESCQSHDITAEVSALDQIRLHGGSLQPLPGTLLETRAIADLVKRAGGEVRLLTGPDATVGGLETRVDGVRYLHLATHGLTGSRQRPYDASLALTYPEILTADDIGFLTLDHLIRKWRGKLSGCDLVVLSACDTQRGVKLGSNVMALPWGFMYAGATSVVASLWKVDDTSTALFMRRFYENLLGKYEDARGDYAPGDRMQKADALREAKQWLRDLTSIEVATLVRDLSSAHGSIDGAVAPWQDATRGKVRETGASPPKGGALRPFAHPYYWTAFGLIADPE